MKNISRRVFIKGMAVAAVATATSTVLAGCNTNMIPDVDNGTDGDTNEDVTPGNTQTVTYTDQANDKKLTIKVSNVVKDELNERVYLYVEVLNELGKKITLGAAPKSADEYGLTIPTSGSVEVKDADGMNIAESGTKVVNDATAATAGVNNLFKSSTQYDVANGESLKGIFVLDDIKKEWSNITVNLQVEKYVGSASVSSYGSVEIKLTNK